VRHPHAMGGRWRYAFADICLRHAGQPGRRHAARIHRGRTIWALAPTSTSKNAMAWKAARFCSRYRRDRATVSSAALHWQYVYRPTGVRRFHVQSVDLAYKQKFVGRQRRIPNRPSRRGRTIYRISLRLTSLFKMASAELRLKSSSIHGA